MSWEQPLAPPAPDLVHRRAGLSENRIDLSLAFPVRPTAIFGRHKSPTPNADFQDSRASFSALPQTQGAGNGLEIEEKTEENRNYALEYLIRMARGLAGGKSRSQARGHARATDLADQGEAQPFKRSSPLENALKLMKQGVSQREAAKQVGVSPETLRRFQKLNTTSVKVGRRWIISDTRPVTVVMATRGKMRDVTVAHDASATSAATGSRSTCSWKPTMRRISPLSSARDCGTARAHFIRSRRGQTSCASSIASANCRSSISIARRCSEAPSWTNYDRFMIRQRALRRAQLTRGQATATYGASRRWGDGPTQEHHPGRRKFSKEVTIMVPDSHAHRTDSARRGGTSTSGD